jgi:UDP-3-O-[3-hydroxymyristoyl] glucosamine N-acyltransferase
MALSLDELAALVGGEVEGDGERQISGVTTLEEAGPDDLSFVTNPRYRRAARASRAGALLVSKGEAFADRDLLVSSDPHYALAQILTALHPEEEAVPGVHPTAVVQQTAKIDPQASIGPFVAIGSGSMIEKGAILHSHVVVGDNCVVGEGTRLYPHVVLYDRTEVGPRVRVHAGTVLGSDGFGFATHEGVHKKIPQLGRVVIEEDVEIGANCTIDRAMSLETRIGKGTKIDNLVQIGHNCRLGENCLIVSQAGLSGSVRLGDSVVMAGKAAAVGHVEVGDGVTLMARAVVTRSVPAGSTLAGFPATDAQSWRKRTVLVRRLEELFERLKMVENRLDSSKAEETL